MKAGNLDNGISVPVESSNLLEAELLFPPPPPPDFFQEFNSLLFWRSHEGFYKFLWTIHFMAQSLQAQYGKVILTSNLF